MFYLVGLGLGDATDITVKGLVIVKTASRVYLEAYTSILTVGKDELVSRCLVSSAYCMVLYKLCIGYSRKSFTVESSFSPTEKWWNKTPTPY